MVILRGCGRCGGDILTGNPKNVRCLQCGYRPDLPIAELRRQGRQAARGRASQPVNVDAILAALDIPEDAPGENRDAPESIRDAVDVDSEASCPRCDDADPIALDKLRSHFNTCYRCKLCGHIYSPAAFRTAS